MRGKSPIDKHDRLARNSDHAVVERAGTLRLRRSSISLYSHSITPSGRSISIATFLNGQFLLEYYDKEELKGSLMDRYPVQFDKQPYDPQLSQQEVEARQEAVEQLFLSGHHAMRRRQVVMMKM
jgi:hypothetical protein